MLCSFCLEIQCQYVLVHCWIMVDKAGDFRCLKSHVSALNFQLWDFSCQCWCRYRENDVWEMFDNFILILLLRSWSVSCIKILVFFGHYYIMFMSPKHQEFSFEFACPWMSIYPKLDWHCPRMHGKLEMDSSPHRVQCLKKYPITVSFSHNFCHLFLINRLDTSSCLVEDRAMMD